MKTAYEDERNPYTVTMPGKEIVAGPKTKAGER
jgi:hypothetical protein